jgi:hypothetical protein
MLKSLPAKVQREIITAISKAAQAQVLIRVYAEADAIRLANISDNIALEDIVQAIIDQSTGGPGCEINPDDARDALLGISAVVH